MEKQKLLYQQARLHDRGAAEMVLQTISASKGLLQPGDAVMSFRHLHTWPSWVEAIRIRFGLNQNTYNSRCICSHHLVSIGSVKPCQ